MICFQLFIKKIMKRFIVIPLFPQYASATTGSVVDKVMKIISKWWVIPEVKFVGQFYDNDGYVNTVVEQASKYKLR